MRKGSGFLKKTVLMLAAMMLFFVLGISAAAADKIVAMTPDENNVLVYVGQDEDIRNVVYHKIRVPSSGLLTVSGNSFYVSSSGTASRFGINITLCNSKFKELGTRTVYLDAGKEKVQAYGVKKGTYYLKTSGEDTYVLAAVFQKQTDNGGSKKAKAKTVKHNKAMAGVAPAGETSSKADWYKFKVTKNKKLQITAQFLGEGTLEFRVYGPSLQKTGVLIRLQAGQSSKSYIVNSKTNKKIKVKKGTYYIKVTRSKYAKKSSGAYSVKWRLR